MKEQILLSVKQAAAHEKIFVEKELVNYKIWLFFNIIIFLIGDYFSKGIIVFSILLFLFRYKQKIDRLKVLEDKING